MRQFGDDRHQSWRDFVLVMWQPWYSAWPQPRVDPEDHGLLLLQRAHCARHVRALRGPTVQMVYQFLVSFRGHRGQDQLWPRFTWEFHKFGVGVSLWPLQPLQGHEPVLVVDVIKELRPRDGLGGRLKNVVVPVDLNLIGVDVLHDLTFGHALYHGLGGQVEQRVSVGPERRPKNEDLGLFDVTRTLVLHLVHMDQLGSDLWLVPDVLQLGDVGWAVVL